MKILVTGANGQLGSEIKALRSNYPDWEFLLTDVDELDLTNFIGLEKYILSELPQIIINCAAYTAVDKAEDDSEKAFLLNAKVPGKLSDIAKKAGAKLIHISTDYVFSGKQNVPLKETEATQPESVYGKTKLEGETLSINNGNPIIIRTSWLYSRFGHNFVKSMLRLGKERDELGVVFDQIGSPTNAADLANAVLTIITDFSATQDWKHGIYHFSDEGVCSWYDFSRAIMDIAGLDCTVLPIETKDYPLPAPRPQFSVMNKSKIKTTFSIDIPYWRDSLTTVIRYLTNNKQ